MNRPEINLLETLPETDIISITKIIVSLSVKFSTRFPFLTIDDCIQEAWSELIKYQSYYISGKSKVTTWVYKLVNDTLTSYAQREFSKTQKWDNIEDHVIRQHSEDANPTESCAYSDLFLRLQEVLSPCCCKLLCYLEQNPSACQLDLAKVLDVPERDVVYLKEELRLTTRHVMEM